MDEPDARDRVSRRPTHTVAAWPPRVAVEASDGHRWLTWSALVAAVGALVLMLFGIPSIDLHGPLHRLGIMDPFCGGTRSWYLLLHGQVGDALRYNPAGPLLMLITMAALIRAAIGMRTGRWVNTTIDRRIYLPVLLVATVALQVNQQMNAPLLIVRWGG
ncbi:uncharacterized protein DUF2752 [Nocardia fluminea]|uniref:Uncharacterized protein DUF2752 n=1 Tax=Nocardia fluminea TaxID=134984 RepID=A0A2N3VHC7_9NOCA|nr:uncharacterized protein DUF2752 [Nocardia fluminea]